MADENMYQGANPERDRVGFCQDCGKPLTAATVRQVGSGVFCEPCLERRIAATPGYGTGYGTSGGGTGPAAPYSGSAANPGTANPGAPYFSGAYPPANGVFPPLDGSTPHPMLAGFLGLIPGVGAMYNGQFAKGFLHLIIFAVLVSLSDNVNGIFSLLVAGWVVFMSFEAYQTARARRDGLPLPDVFGWNNVGDRIGLKNWNATPRPTGTAWNPPQGPAAPGTAAPQPPPDWVGYVPPTHFATTPQDTHGAGIPPVPPPAAPYAPAPYYAPASYAEDLTASIQTQAIRDANYPYTASPQNVAYVPAFTGTTPPADALSVPVPAKRFPAGAMWLIGLGLLFLLGNLDPSLRLSWRWLLPVFLGGVAVWMFVHRFTVAERMGRSAASLVCSLRAPSLLITLAVLFALQTAHWLTLGQTWPVFFIVLGGLLLLERTVGRPAYVPVAPVSPMPPAPGDPVRWTGAGGPTEVGKTGDTL